jgi:hypothetical protein
MMQVIEGGGGVVEKWGKSRQKDCEKLRSVSLGWKCSDSCHIGNLQCLLPDDATVKRQTDRAAAWCRFERISYAEVANGQFASSTSHDQQASRGEKLWTKTKIASIQSMPLQ